MMVPEKPTRNQRVESVNHSEVRSAYALLDLLSLSAGDVAGLHVGS